VKADQRQAREYQRQVDRLSPKKPIAKNCLAAFIVGGLICVVGQVFLRLLESGGMVFADATTTTSVVMIGLGGLLTGLGVYDEIGRTGGMGAALPITGFANAMVSPAMEFRREGLVLGVGSRMFSVAGPVVIYGLAVSTVVGIVRHLLLAP